MATTDRTGHAGAKPRRIRDAADAQRPTPLELRALERVFAEAGPAEAGSLERRAFTQARKRARESAIEALQGGDSGADATQAALLAAAAEMFGAMRAQLTAAPEDAAHTVARLEDALGLSRVTLAREVLQDPGLLTMPPAAAVQAQLALLTAFAPLRSASLWMHDDAEQLRCTGHVGEGGPSRGARQLAQRIMAGERVEPCERGLLLGLPVGRWRRPLAALVGSARPGMREHCRPYLAAAAPMVGAILEREALLEANAVAERAIGESSERKLTRLGFDLHDGPIQDVAVLAEDLRGLRRKLERGPRAAGDGGRWETIRAQMDDLDAQLLALDTELRRISNEVRAASVLLNRPFAAALRDVVQAFAARTDVEPDVTLTGDMKLLSASQQIALLNIIHEALTNVREHSHATGVQVSVTVGADGVEARVLDDGRGFELEPTLIRAAREGRLGLVAMHERVRLLGGQCRIDTRSGGPTAISVALERWEPVAQEQAPARATA